MVNYVLMYVCQTFAMVLRCAEALKQKHFPKLISPGKNQSLSKGALIELENNLDFIR